MPFQRKRATLQLTDEATIKLTEISRSRTESLQRIERAKILLAYAEGDSVSAIARMFHTNRPKIERCIDKALQLGPLAALEDLPGRGKPPSITKEARAWIISLACQKPKELGYSYELWTTRLLAKHIRTHCQNARHLCLNRISRGTVSKILTSEEIRPHKIKYYLEKRDPEFDEKMVQVLHVYKEVAMIRKAGEVVPKMTAFLSCDEKPGIQAIENRAPDLSPEPPMRSSVERDYEYIRHGTVSLLAGIDLLNGKIYGVVEDRHRSKEFISLLKILDQCYAPGIKIRIILDNHSSHISKETRKYLASVANRFEFIFTPTHGSWLNMIEMFFSKMTKTMLRGIRVSSKKELKERIMKYLDEVNESPVIFKWKYGLESISVANSH